MNIDRFRISTRLTFTYGLVLSITALIAAVGIWRLGTLMTATQEIATTATARSALATQWMVNIQLNSLRLVMALKSSDAATIEALERDIRATTTASAEIQKSLAAVSRDEKSQQLLAEIAARRTSYLDRRASLLDRKKAGDDVASAVDRELGPVVAAFLASLSTLVEHVGVQREQLLTETFALARQSQWLLGSGAVVAIGVAALFGFAMVRSIGRQLGAEPGEAAQLARGVAGGDLGVPIHLRTGDTTSLMAQLKAMQDSLVQVVGNVRRNSESVATASAQIAQGNNDLSSRTEQQASALQQTAASMEELSSTVKQNADNAREANQLALGAATVAGRGGEVVGQVVATMKDINESSRQIADIIGVIDGIAFQTNILALNAAVEAARAGEQGRGFTDIVGQISAASAEQSTGVAQVGEAIGQMDQATQQNAALVEESSAAAESLKQQAQQLVEAVAVFRLDTARVV